MITMERRASIKHRIPHRSVDNRLAALLKKQNEVVDGIGFIIEQLVIYIGQKYNEYFLRCQEKFNLSIGITPIFFI